MSNSEMLLRLQQKEETPVFAPVIQLFDERGLIADTQDQRKEGIVTKIPGHTLHHIVPVDAITKNWNKWLKDPRRWIEQMLKLCDMFDSLLTRDDRHHLIVSQEDVDHVRQLIFQVSVNLTAGLPPFANTDGNVTSTALGMMQWMPYNFVVGATHRAHDPGSNLDVEAAKTQPEYIEMANTYQTRIAPIHVDSTLTAQQKDDAVSHEMFGFYDAELDMADKKLTPLEKQYAYQRQILIIMKQFESVYNSILTQCAGISSAAETSFTEALKQIRETGALDTTGLDHYDAEKIAGIRAAAPQLSAAAKAVEAYLCNALKVKEQEDMIKRFPAIIATGSMQLKEAASKYKIPEINDYAMLMEQVLSNFTVKTTVLDNAEICKFITDYMDIVNSLIALKTVSDADKAPETAIETEPDSEVASASDEEETSSGDAGGTFGGMFGGMFDEPTVTERTDVSNVIANLHRINLESTETTSLPILRNKDNPLPKFDLIRSAFLNNMDRTYKSMEKRHGFRYLNEDRPNELM